MKKECSKCKMVKEVSEFSQWKDKDTGKTVINHKCKSCSAEYSRNRYAVNKDKLRMQMKERYAQNREQSLWKAKAYYELNKEEIKARNKRYYEANKSLVLIRIEEWQNANPEKYKAAQNQWVNNNREKVRDSANKYARNNKAKAKERWQAMRRMVMEAYGGPVCSCCGETIYEFLTIDHINNDGAEHRRAIGQHLYRWLIENDYPSGFQVLCMNCNYGKQRNGGVCPHKPLESSTTIESTSKGGSE
jgi:hypothetical protein